MPADQASELIGKTALVSAFLAELPPGTRTLQVECSPVKSELPLSIVCDLLRIVTELGGDRLSVIGLMGEGVDPHLYKASPGDLRLLSQVALAVLPKEEATALRMGRILPRRRRPTAAARN